MAIDLSGNIHISYYDATNGNLKYADNTTGWSIEIVDSSSDVGQFASLALDDSGMTHISYFDQTNVEVKYATGSFGSWSTETIDSADDVGLYTNFALDLNGGNSPCGPIPFDLYSEASCTAEVFFNPGSKGFFSTQLESTTEDGSVTMALNGIGVGGLQDILPIPDSISFGNTTARATALESSLAIYNLGSDELSISDMVINGSNLFELDVNGGLALCGSTAINIPKGEYCTVSIRFARTDLGAFSGSLSIDSDDPDQPTQSIPLSGTVSEVPSDDTGGGNGGGGCFISTLAY